jgi:Fe-Mn family superoxide dismutase
LATLAFNHEEITARGLKPALLELDGISRETVEAHYKLYEGYVNKRNEIMEKLAEIDLASANQVYSEVRALKVELSFAIGGIKNHEIYFEHLGGGGWAWTAYDWDEGRLFNYVGDAQNTYPIWNATPLVALDVYEHAYFIDYHTDRASYIDAFFNNLDWDAVNAWVQQYQITT